MRRGHLRLYYATIPSNTAMNTTIITLVALLLSSLSNAYVAPPKVTVQSSGVSTLLQSTHAVNAEMVWASGHGGAVVRTVNGGTTWTKVTAPGNDSLEFRDVHAISADIAWILSAGSGKKSRIYKTINGGASWTLQFMNNDSAAFYDCLTMLDSRVGVAYSDATNGETRILRTVNGGDSWTLVGSQQLPAPLAGEGAFAASGQCVVHSSQTRVFVATGAPSARLLSSTDAGASWTASGTPFVRGEVAGLTGLAFIDSLRGAAVAADINRLRNDTSSHVIGLTADGGKSWQLTSRPPLPGALAGITIVPRVSEGSNQLTLVAVGYGGAFWSDNGGNTWHVITDQIFTGATAVARTAWITGARGQIIRLDW